jgi:hypothetical protein
MAPRDGIEGRNGAVGGDVPWVGVASEKRSDDYTAKLA